MLSDLLRAAAPLALAAAFVAGPARAQDAVPAETPADAASGDETGEDILVTAQRTNQSEVVREGDLGVLGNKNAADVPFNVRSYNSALIYNRQPTTLGQVLENDPSIRTTYAFGNAAELFVIRGFPLTGDDIALNGLFGIVPRQIIAPELYEQVQVLNGASAFLFGAAPGGSGIGGNVNLVPKRAGRKDVMRATANYTSDSHFGGSVDVSHRFGDDGAFGVRLNGAYRAGDVATDGEFRRAAVAGIALDWSRGAVRVSADAAYQRYQVRGLRPKVTIASAVPRVPQADANYAQGYTYSTLRDIFGSARIEWDVADNAMFYLTGGARDGKEGGIYDGITITDPVTGAGNGGASIIPFTTDSASVQGGFRAKLQDSFWSHEINVGGSHIWGVNRSAYDFRTGYATNLYDTPQVTLSPTTLFAAGDMDDPTPIQRTRLGSAFASDTIGFFDDRLLITGGLRLQQITTRGYDYNTQAQINGYSETAITPIAGVVIKPVEGLSLYGNRIESLAPGQQVPVSFTYPGIGVLPISNAGETFAPFKSVQYEIGGKLAIGQFNASLAVFDTKRPFAIGVLNPGGGSVSFNLNGEQRHRGIELGLDGEITRGLRLIAGATYIDAELRRTQNGTLDGNDARGVPEYTVNANVEWDLPFAPGLTVTGRVVQTGEQAVDDANTLYIGDWTRFDLGARYVAILAERAVTFRFNVDNVANERYWASSYDSFGNALLQGLPRTFKASASIDF